jgi:hypothetical protein
VEASIARGQPRFLPTLMETSESSDESRDSTMSSTESALVLKAIKKFSMKIDRRLDKIYGRLNIAGTLLYLCCMYCLYLLQFWWSVMFRLSRSII